MLSSCLTNPGMSCLLRISACNLWCTAALPANRLAALCRIVVGWWFNTSQNSCILWILSALLTPGFAECLVTSGVSCILWISNYDALMGPVASCGCLVASYGLCMVYWLSSLLHSVHIWLQSMLCPWFHTYRNGCILEISRRILLCAHDPILLGMVHSVGTCLRPKVCKHVYLSYNAIWKMVTQKQRAFSRPCQCTPGYLDLFFLPLLILRQIP